MIKMPYIWGEREGQLQDSKKLTETQQSRESQSWDVGGVLTQEELQDSVTVVTSSFRERPTEQSKSEADLQHASGSDMAGCCQVPGRPLIKDTLLGCLETFVGSSQGTACPLRVSWMDVLSSMQVYKGRLSGVSSECSFWLLVPHHKSRLLIFIS